MMMRFSALRTSYYGITYEMDDDGSVTELNPEDKWAIDTPTDEVIAKYPDCEVSEFGEKTFLLSKGAASSIPRQGTDAGSTCLLHCGDVAIMLIDDKWYVQFPQGKREEGETPVECIAREVGEELAIHIDEERYSECGFWKHTLYNKLVDHKRNITTTLFREEVKQDEIAHLIPDDVDLSTLDKMIVVPACDGLDKTEFICFIPKSCVADLPDKIDAGDRKNIALTGHHRIILAKFAGVEYDVDLKYLDEFVVDV